MMAVDRVCLILTCALSFLVGAIVGAALLRKRSKYVVWVRLLVANLVVAVPSVAIPYILCGIEVAVRGFVFALSGVAVSYAIVSSLTTKDDAP
jgi:hypothetical protein